VETSNDPTAHAEMLCIRSAAAQLGGWRLTVRNVQPKCSHLDQSLALYTFNNMLLPLVFGIIFFAIFVLCFILQREPCPLRTGRTMRVTQKLHTTLKDVPFFEY
jgi:hypothetical protein